jgi:hypothetical protein
MVFNSKNAAGSGVIGGRPVLAITRPPTKNEMTIQPTILPACLIFSVQNDILLKRPTITPIPLLNAEDGVETTEENFME